jgi:hypothetical protein
MALLEEQQQQQPLPHPPRRADPSQQLIWAAATVSSSCSPVFSPDLPWSCKTDPSWVEFGVFLDELALLHVSHDNTCFGFSVGFEMFHTCI